MAILPTVMFTPDRRWRIEVNVNNHVYLVYRDGALVSNPRTLPDLLTFLAANGVDETTLIEG